MSNDTLLQVEGLEKSFYLHEQGKRIPSSRDVNLGVRRGRLTALVGPTGSGKSSVLKAVYRSYLPGGGRIVYRSAQGEDIDLARAPEHRILELRRNEIGFVTQFLYAPPRRATLDVVAQPLYALGVARQEGRDRAAELLVRLNVPERLWCLAPATFSGGEKQRVNLARGVIARPRLLLLDEPTASLDRATTLRVVELFRELKTEGVGMLAVFHDPALVEALADERVELPPVAEFSIEEEVA